MQKIDAHQHFWHYTPAAFPWISDEMAVLKKDFLPAHLQPLLQAHEYAGCIAVQASQTEEETSFLLGLADQYDFIKGVVGWIHLQDYNVKHAIRKWANHPKLCGFRHIIHDEPDDLFMLRPDFMRGVKALKEFNLTYDILIFEKHLPATLQFVSYLPDIKMVVDHIAKPKIKQQELTPWQDNIRSLAQYPNVYCKISGLVTEADWHQWKEDDFKPYLDTVVEAFGIERLMVGSDWPVCTVAAAYGKVMAIVEHYFQPFSASEREKIFGQNAMRFYNIK